MKRSSLQRHVRLKAKRNKSGVRILPSASKPAKNTFPDGREVLNTNLLRGRELYRNRIWEMVQRQGWRCCLADYCPTCPQTLRGYDPTFDHERGRGMGGAKRDDRIEVDGKWINGAAHLQCNNWKGSRFIPYNG